MGSGGWGGGCGVCNWDLGHSVMCYKHAIPFSRLLTGWYTTIKFHLKKGGFPIMHVTPKRGGVQPRQVNVALHASVLS